MRKIKKRSIKNSENNSLNKKAFYKSLKEDWGIIEIVFKTAINKFNRKYLEKY